jgi:hypothetical protein
VGLWSLSRSVVLYRRQGRENFLSGLSRSNILSVSGQSSKTDLPEERPVVIEEVLLDDPAVAPLGCGGVKQVE